MSEPAALARRSSMANTGFSCSKHDAFGIGVDHCALCSAERDPIEALRAEGRARGRMGTLSDADQDVESWRAFVLIAKLIGFSGVVPDSWRAAWHEGYFGAVADRHRDRYGLH